MKEHGLLFTGEMVRAMLRPIDPKNQTRRVITYDNSITIPHIKRSEWPELRWDEAELKIDHFLTTIPFWEVPFGIGHVDVYPRIEPGHKIWVRETWAAPHEYDHLPPRLIPQDTRIYYAADERGLGGLVTRVSIHMPRWAARIIHDVPSIRSQRVQEISEIDAKGEGSGPLAEGHPLCLDNYRMGFEMLWNRINAAKGHGWDTNPPVWIYDLKEREDGK